jgi:iron complex outermembrane receptor protein
LLFFFLPSAPSATTNVAPDGTYSDLNDVFGQLRTEYDLTDNVMAYVAVGTRYMKESGRYATPTLTSSDGTGTMGSSLIKRVDTDISAKSGVRAKFATGSVDHEFNTGVSGIWQTNRNAYNFLSGGTVNIYTGSSTAPTTQSSYSGSFEDLPLADKRALTSFFVADTAKFFDDKIQLTLGARRQRVKIDDATPTSYSSQTNGYTIKTYDESATTPFVGLNVRFTDYLSTYANYVEALQPGEEVTDNTASNYGQMLAPYKSKQYEIGTKLDFGTFGGSIALFQIDKPSAYNNGGTYETAGNQRNRGIELQAFGEPVKGTRVLGGITFNDAELTETKNGTNQGNTPRGIPRYIAKVGVEYDLPFLKGATVNARLIRTGEQYVRDDNSLELPAWTRLDIGGQYKMDVYNYPVTIRANIENVTNADYWSSASTNAAFYDYVTEGAPLTATVSLTADF